MLALSACLAGVNCKYNGGNNTREACHKLLNQDNALLLCPEVITSLGCPREAAEIVGAGGGQGVWQGTAQVVTASGQDVSEEFKSGALACLETIKANPELEAVLLQPRSPSCGVDRIYDGTFSGHLITGDGVFAALLKQHGIPVFDVDKYLEQSGRDGI